MSNERKIELFLKWFNDYLTVAVFAENHELTINEAHKLIEEGKRLHNEQVAMLPALGQNK